MDFNYNPNHYLHEMTDEQLNYLEREAPRGSALKSNINMVKSVRQQSYQRDLQKELLTKDK